MGNSQITTKERKVTFFRSHLFVPGDNESLIAKSRRTSADAVVFDLEDAVSFNQKQKARSLIASTLAELEPSSFFKPAIFVRINAVSTSLWQEDIACLRPLSLSGIRLAKAESATEILAVSQVLDKIEEQAKLPPGTLPIIPTIESAIGLVAASEMARLPRVTAFAFGNADFLRDIGADEDEQEIQTLYARSKLVIVSRAAGINPPIASVYTKVKDLDGLRASTEGARRLGFFGRSCIHPAQIDAINQVFTPSAEQVAEAETIVAAFDKAEATGKGVTMLPNGQFIDRPIVEKAKAMLEFARFF